MISYITILFTVGLLTFYNCNHTLALQSCSKDRWKISFNNNHSEGEASLVFALSYQQKMTLHDVTIMLSCTDIKVRGSGKISIRLHKHFPSSVLFNISLPRPQNFKAYLAEDNWMNHTCIYKIIPKGHVHVASDKSTIPKSCQVKFKSFHGRILPNCDKNRGKIILDKLDIRKNGGNVMIYFKNSPNDVITIDSDCRNGNIVKHTRDAKLLRNVFPLTPRGVQPAIISIDFYPNCDNKTISSMFQNRYLSDCYLEIYLICQEGMVLIEMVEPVFNKSVMHCPPPKSSVTLLSEHLILASGIASIPVVLLGSMAVSQGIITFILIIILVIKFAYIKYYGPNHNNNKSIAIKEKESELLIRKTAGMRDEYSSDDEDIYSKDNFRNGKGNYKRKFKRKESSKKDDSKRKEGSKKNYSKKFKDNLKQTSDRKKYMPKRVDFEIYSNEKEFQESVSTDSSFDEYEYKEELYVVPPPDDPTPDPSNLPLVVPSSLPQAIPSLSPIEPPLLPKPILSPSQSSPSPPPSKPLPLTEKPQLNSQSKAPSTTPSK